MREGVNKVYNKERAILELAKKYEGEGGIKRSLPEKSYTEERQAKKGNKGKTIKIIMNMINMNSFFFPFPSVKKRGVSTSAFLGG